MPRSAYSTRGNTSEAQLRDAILDYGRRYVGRYEGDWTAPWLLSDCHSTSWILRTPETRKVGDEWRGATTFHWDFLLPDGTQFTDPRHLKLRTMMQEIAFLFRYHPRFRVASTVTHTQFLSSLNTIVRWMYLRDGIYKPDSYALKFIDLHGICEYISEYRLGGKAWVLQLPQRTMLWMYAGALDKDPDWAKLGTNYGVPNGDRKRIIQWLRENGYYLEKWFAWCGTTLETIDRSKLAKQLSVEYQTLRSSRKYGALLRQFEPDVIRHNAKVLVPSDLSRNQELPQQTMQLVDEVSTADHSVRAVAQQCQTWINLFSLHAEYPNQIPEITERDRRRIQALIPPQQHASHTPWIPLKTALTYMGEAIHWVSAYEKPLIEFYLEAVRTFIKNDWFKSDKELGHSAKKARLRNDWVRTHCPEELRVLNIGGWTSSFTTMESDAFSNLRCHPSLTDAMSILIGAIVIVVASMKPLRESELRRLDRNCLRYSEGDGYWLEQSLRKAGIGDQLPKIERPIPKVASEAISGLQRLGGELSLLTREKDRYARQALFYLPQFNRDASFKVSYISNTEMTGYLNRFCDYVALPPDEHGRRWYIRIHEMRRSFLITFFWCYRFSSLDAARWMAGHANIEDVYAYIEANFPGDELPHLYAEYAAQQLWNFSKGAKGETENVAELYRSVCRHFRASEISLIPATELLEWLTLSFEDGTYDIKAYTIRIKNHGPDVAIAFKVEDGSANA